MRIIGEIQHPTLKISIFKTGERISVKFENALYEQTFKLGTEERFQSLEAIKTLADAPFLAEVMQIFGQMHRLKMAAQQRAFPATGENLFESIL